MPKEESMLHVIRGQSFEVAVSADSSEPRHQVVIRDVRDAQSPIGVPKQFECTAEQAREIAILAKTAAAMAEFLNEGGTVEHWTEHTITGESFSNN
jgi:hypothetical protein